MTAARACDWTRTTAAAVSLFGGRAVPAGLDGVVLAAMPDGTCLAELVVTPRTGTAISCSPSLPQASTRLLSRSSAAADPDVSRPARG